MKKQLCIMVSTMAVLGVASAYGMNPFSDVTPDSWAYQSVSQLASAGIINGYPDGTFKGQNDITRYEMAQMVAKAMANQDRANAEQQAMINRLADEFSNELNNLGVRVSRLEDRVGNVKVTGDMRLRYLGSQYKNGAYAGSMDKKSLFDMRGRVQFNANVNDRTEAVVRVTSGDVEFGSGEQRGQATFDRAYVNHRFGDRVSVKAGRFNQVFGAGLMYDDTFDGAQFNAGNDTLQFQAAYGYGVEGALANRDKVDNIEFAYTGLSGKIGDNLTLGGFYARANGTSGSPTQAYKNIYGFNAEYNFHNIWLGGEWLKDSHVADSTAWVAGVGYGNYDMAKAGTWGVKGQYFNQKGYAPIFSSTWNQAYDLSSSATVGYGYKGWMATVDYALQNNVGLSAYYGFNGKDQDGDSLPNFYRAELNYQF